MAVCAEADTHENCMLNSRGVGKVNVIRHEVGAVCSLPKAIGCSSCWWGVEEEQLEAVVDDGKVD